MTSQMERISSTRSSFSNKSTPLMRGRVVIAYDATKTHSIEEFKETITNIQMRDGMIREGDTITVLGVLHKVLHPMGFQMQIGPNSLFGTHVRAIKEEVSRKVDTYVSMLQQSADDCEGKGVDMEVKIAVGSPTKKVVVQEVAALNATWVVLDRQLRKELRFYIKHIPCKVAVVLENLGLEVLRPYYSDNVTATVKQKLLYSLSKPVPLSASQNNENNEQSVITSIYPGSFRSLESSDIHKSDLVSSFAYNSKEYNFVLQNELGSDPQKENSGTYDMVKNKHDDSPPVMQEQRNLPKYSDVPNLCIDREMKTCPDLKGPCDIEIEIATDEFLSENLLQEGVNAKVEGQCDHSPPCTASEIEMGLDPMGYSYTEIQIATDNFSFKNLLGGGTYGVVYKGKLKNGQLITAKVQKEASTDGIAEFLRFARHKNIEMLLGYCFKEDFTILVYEFICNKSLEWHLFGNTKHVLQWHQRHSIAMGIAKGLRFLHEECRGISTIHCDVRPCNILFSHDFVPLLADCGLAKWKTNKDDMKTTHNGSIAYLAPEYAENGAFSVQTDVYAFGIVLIQLISGQRCKVVDSTRDNHQKSLAQWALPLIQMLAFDELVDPRLGDSYNTYELYNMARAACMCIQTEPMMRPSMGEVLHLLEGKNDHLYYLTGQFKPHRVTGQTACKMTIRG